MTLRENAGLYFLQGKASGKAVTAAAMLFWLRSSKNENCVFCTDAVCTLNFQKRIVNDAICIVTWACVPKADTYTEKPKLNRKRIGASMILSMTGFGRGTAVLNGREITVELRSVNSRYFEYSSRIPRTCSSLDSRLKSSSTSGSPAAR